MTMHQQAVAAMSAIGRFGRFRLSRRLLVWFLVFSLIPLFATNAVGYVRSRGIIARLVERYLRAVAGVESQHIAARVERHLLMLQAITAGNAFLAAGSLEFQGRDGGDMGGVATPKAIHDFLEAKLDELGAFDAIYLFTPDGRVIARAGDSTDVFTTPPKDVTRAALAVARRTGPAGTEPHFRLVAPVFYHGREVVAFLAGTVSLDRFAQFLQVPPHLAGRVHSFIVDQNGRLLFISHSHGPVDYETPFPSPLLNGKTDFRDSYVDRDGTEVIGLVQPILGTPWRYIAEVPAVDALGELRQLGGISLLFEVLFMTALGVAAWLVSRSVVAPLRRLVDGTRRVAQGDLGVRVEVLQQDEIGELGRSFNDMTAALAETTARVHELHQREIERASQLATVGELASGIAHEIKNPVVGVSNGLDLVRRRIGPDPTLQPIMDEMRRQLSRIQGTLQELLTFARPTVPTLVPVSANSVVDRAIRLVQPAADNAHVHVAVHLDHHAPRFPADEEMLYQAVVNVLMNAVQASSDGDHITVTTRSTADQVEIEVEDTGRGIAAADRDLVFKPFFTTRHTGTGLGLSITRGIVERHGGGVALDSTEGVGTTVTISLPLQPVAPPAEEPVLV